MSLSPDVPAPSDGRLADLLERIARLLQSRLHAEGLLPVHWHALRYLARANRFSRSPKAVGLFLGVTKGTTSQTLIALERRGLVHKAAAARDGRSVSIALTEAGRALLARDPLAGLAQGRVGDPSGRAAGEAFVEALLADLLARQGGRPFGQCAGCRFFQPRAAAEDPDGPHRCGLIGVALSEPDSRLVCLEQQPRQAVPLSDAR